MHLFLLWALLAAVAWGTADFCAKKAANALGFWATVWGMNTVGAAALGLLWLAGGIPVQRSHLPQLLLLGVGNTIGGVFFYYALEFGPLVLVSPITASYPVISALLAFFVSGERLGGLIAGAVAGVIVGTLLASIASPDPGTVHVRRGSAILAAMAGSITFGAVFFALAAIAGNNATAAPVLIFRLVGGAALALPVLWGARLPVEAFRSPWIWLTGMLDSTAYLFYAAGARQLPISVVSSLGGLFSVWTLVLAVVFLRERIAWRQWLGVALILGSIALLALK